MEDRAAGVYITAMSGSCCHDCHDDDPQRGNPAYRRVLWIVLAINAVMFAVEVGAGLAAGSVSLQADALDFLGDAGNYAISLFVVGMALRYRATAALAKGPRWQSSDCGFSASPVGMPGTEHYLKHSPWERSALRPWLRTPRHLGCYGGIVGATPTCDRRGFALVMMFSGILPCCWPHWACLAPAQAGPMFGGGDHGDIGAARGVHCHSTGTGRIAKRETGDRTPSRVGRGSRVMQLAWLGCPPCLFVRFLSTITPSVQKT
jgi:hypothetical protein